jgi:hypothetical protein
VTELDMAPVRGKSGVEYESRGGIRPFNSVRSTPEQKDSERKLDVFFESSFLTMSGSKGSSEAKYNDTEILQMSTLLEKAGHASWSKVPRLYIVLRRISQLDLLEEFIRRGITDSRFPFTAAAASGLLPVHMQLSFLETQQLIFRSIVRIEHGEHIDLPAAETVPAFETLESLGQGLLSHVEKVENVFSRRLFA